MLQVTNQTLTSVNRELEEFAYVASHDLQEPLRMVRIYTQLILKELGEVGGTVKQYADFVDHGAHRMEDLLRDLLSFSRAAHLDTPEAESADLRAVLADALSVLRNLIDETGAEVAVASLPLVHGDPSQLAHVFQNLISNSIKYRHDSRRPVIEISAERLDAHWVIAVRDNGIGFDQRYADRIFGLFKRLHKEEYPGTGLGLAICQRIVQRYGGRMWAMGRPGEGATFYFALKEAVSPQVQ